MDLSSMSNLNAKNAIEYYYKTLTKMSKTMKTYNKMINDLYVKDLKYVRTKPKQDSIDRDTK